MRCDEQVKQKGEIMLKGILGKGGSLPLRVLFQGFSLLIFAFLALVPCFAAEKLNATQLIELVKSKSPELQDAITGNFESKALKEGTAWAGHGPDFSPPPKRLRSPR